MLVRDRMTRKVLTVSPSTTVAEALTLTRDNAIRHIPVVDGETLTGLVTDRDLRLATPAPWTEPTASERKALTEKTVADLMVADVLTVPPTMLIEEAARLFYENRIGCLPVMDDGKLVGILTASDLLRAFVDIFTTHEKSSRMEIRMPNRPGELARVVRLIGIDYKLNITGLVMTAGKKPTESLMTLHVQTGEPEPLIEALQKMGYAIGYPSFT